MRREWNGKNPSFTLRSHINKTREAQNEMTRAAQFIDYQVPNEHTQVGRMIKSITFRDPAIVSAITHIQGSGEQRNSFEKAADFLLLTAPSTQTRNSEQRLSATPSDNNNSFKHNGRKTGIELRYYSKAEYNKLTAD